MEVLLIIYIFKLIKTYSNYTFERYLNVKTGQTIDFIFNYFQFILTVYTTAVNT